ncbi:hypothetical protein EON63_19660 [archaeon]|nr:MAG: hypothetical protein EON63_19660 [archaeon]
MATLAQTFGQTVHDLCQVLVYFYGRASGDRMRMKDVRRSLGYFRRRG